MPYVQDCGSVFDSGTATHHLTLYRHASGTLVFGAGTVQWAWGPGTRTILCRAVDDSGNLEAPAAGVTVSVSEID